MVPINLNRARGIFFFGKKKKEKEKERGRGSAKIDRIPNAKLAYSRIRL